MYTVLISSPSIASQGQTTTTATLITSNSVEFKQYFVNPWSPQPCTGGTVSIAGPTYLGLAYALAVAPTTTTLDSQGSSPPVTTGVPIASLEARGHSLIAPNATQANGLPVSTVVSGGFTL